MTNINQTIVLPEINLSISGRRSIMKYVLDVSPFACIPKFSHWLFEHLPSTRVYWHFQQVKCFLKANPTLWNDFWNWYADPGHLFSVGRLDFMSLSILSTAWYVRLCFCLKAKNMALKFLAEIDAPKWRDKFASSWLELVKEEQLLALYPSDSASESEDAMSDLLSWEDTSLSWLAAPSTKQLSLSSSSLPLSEIAGLNLFAGWLCVSIFPVNWGEINKKSVLFN